MKPKLLLLLLIFSFSLRAQDSTKIENLATFAKVYGYVRYFHPSDEASNLDWNKFAIYGSDKVEKCSSKEDLMKVLDELFRPIAPSILFFDSQKKIKYNLNQITPDNIGKYKKIFWQHLGVSAGMDNSEGPYASVRVNRKVSISKYSEKANGFGNVMTILRTKEFNGKTIKLTGNVQIIKGSKGDGHLWLRVDNENKTRGFFDNMYDRPIVDTEWKKYEIIGRVDSNTEAIAFGCFLTGEGKLLVDDIKLFYQEEGSWIEIPVGNKGFESEELSSVAEKKTWVGKGGDYKISIADEGCLEGKKCVSIEKISHSEIRSMKKIFDTEPEFGEMINKEIGSGISCIIPLVLYGNDDGTFPKGANINLDSINLNSFENDKSLFWGDVIITWNVFQHFFPYFDVVKVNWEEELSKALRKCYSDKSKSDLILTLEQLTAMLHDGHIYVDGNVADRFIPAISWEVIENKLVITNVCDKNLKLKPGDIVTEVNGKDPKKYFEDFEKRISAATKGWMSYRVNNQTLMGEKDSKITIRVQNENIELIRSKYYYEGRCEGSNPDFSYRFIANDIAYMNLDKIEMKSIDSLLPKLTKCKAIICDLRGYPNGNHYFISYLLTKDDTDKWMQIPQIIYPDQERLAGWDKEGWEMKSKKPHLNSKIIFIIDGQAISYAESYMGFIEGYKLATIVGQPTAGTNGNVNSFTLPGRISISWTGMKVVKHDGSQQHGIGILPNVYVEKTIKGVVEGRDEFLEKAIQIANE